MKITSLALALLVSLSGAGRISADVEKINENKLAEIATTQMFELMKDLGLSSEQKAAIRKLNYDDAGKFKRVLVKMDSVLTPQQKKARKEAIRAALAAKKKGKDFTDAIKASVTLTDEQKAKITEIGKELVQLRKELHAKILAVLTPEQREQVQQQLLDEGEPQDAD